MGHDICGFDKEGEGKKEIAYLRRGAFNPLKVTIYDALDAQEQNCGCSGCGGDPVHFSAERLRSGLEKIPTGEDFDPERKFLNDCIANGADGVWIGFW